MIEIGLKIREGKNAQIASERTVCLKVRTLESRGWPVPWRKRCLVQEGMEGICRERGAREAGKCQVMDGFASCVRRLGFILRAMERN